MPNYRHASRAIIRSEYRPLSHNAMVVLAVMSTWAAPSDAEPVCFKEQESIARRAKLSPRSVRNALIELERAGAIKRAGTVGGHALKRGTIRWVLILLCGDDPLAAPHADKDALPAPRADKGTPAPRADKEAAPRADNSSQSQSGSNGAMTTTDQAALRDHPAEARTPVGARPSNGPVGESASAIVAEVIAARGGTAAAAERWIERRLAASTRPVRNELAFIRGCLANEAAEGSAPPKPAKRAPVKRAGTAAKAAKSAPAKRAGTAAKATSAVRPSRPSCRRCGRPVSADDEQRLCASCLTGETPPTKPCPGVDDKPCDQQINAAWKLCSRCDAEWRRRTTACVTPGCGKQGTDFYAGWRCRDHYRAAVPDFDPFGS
jgi:hypothetical protein